MVLHGHSKQYLANGGFWTEENPKEIVRNIIDSLDKKSILHRLKQELTAKLQA